MPDIPRSRTWLVLAGTIVLQVAIIRSATVLRHGLERAPGAGHGEDAFYRRQNLGLEEAQTLVSLPYTDWYAGASPLAKPAIAAGYLLLLSFLFSFIGIVASDFFCPNLATIANYLGLSETTAGVTFLAFGNGSPDVFSTFSAMNQGTFSLAIGELIGAATFITSIVVGSIAFIRPFYVPKTAFIRDITFFTAAVVVLVVVLRDGHLTLLESTAMVALYTLYVIVVITMNVLARRRRRLDPPAYHQGEDDNGWKSLPGSTHLIASNNISPLATPRPSSLHLPSPHLEEPPSPGNDDGQSAGSLTPTGPYPRRRSRSHSHAHLHLHGLNTPDYAETPRANFSLLGAIEFRDVVNSLKRESVSVSRTPSPSRSPFTAVERAGGDYFTAGHRRSVSQAAARRTSVQYRSRAISHVVQPGSMATFTMTPSDMSPKRIMPSRTTSAPGPKGLMPSTVVAESDEEGDVSSVGISPTSSSTSPENPWKDQTGNPPSKSTAPPPRPSLPKLAIPEPLFPKRRHGATPSISVMDPSGHVEEPIFSPPRESEGPSPPRHPSTGPGSVSTGSTESRFRIRYRTRLVLRVLFPSLQSFRHKSLFGKLLSVFSVPAIFVLTLTLPVVDDGSRDEGGIALPDSDVEPLAPDLEPGPQEEEDEEEGFDEEEDPFLRPDVGEGLHHLVEGGFSPLHSPLGRIHHSVRRVSEAAGAQLNEEEEGEGDMTKELLEELEQEEALEFNMPLCAAQCIFGPTFCAYIVFGDFNVGLWIILGCAIAGVLAAVAVLKFGTDGTSRPWRMVRCMAGFTCSMVWIAAIADEVVSVLQSIGELMGLSDAIIGLTIFAIGNSMADLVANITVAQFAPAMAYAACFGGPMLNLLLGVGGSGTYHLLFHPHKPVNLHFSPTLWVSATGLIIILLTTAVVVPLNGYLIDRRWAACLVLAYGTLMIANVAVEIKTGRS